MDGTILAAITAVLVSVSPGKDVEPLAAFVGDHGPKLCNMNEVLLNRTAAPGLRYRCDLLEVDVDAP